MNCKKCEFTGNSAVLTQHMNIQHRGESLVLKPMGQEKQLNKPKGNSRYD